MAGLCTIDTMLAPALLTAIASVQASLPAPSPPPSSSSTAQAAPPVELERAARPLTTREARLLGVGAWLPDAAGVDLDGRARSWRDGAGERGTVLVLTSLTCPLGMKLAPEVARVEARARGVGFGFVHVALDGLDSVDALRRHVRRSALTGLVLRDEGGELARALDARTTTEVFVADARGTLRYRGAVNDQYGLGFALDAPRHTYLDDALRALIRGEEPAISATSAPGCVVERNASVSPDRPHGVTYARDIARLVQNNCAECHRAGGVAPFALDSYDAVAKRASMLHAVVEDGTMPPWFASADGGGPWANDRSLSADERLLFAQWIAAGKPRGDDMELPLPREFPAAGWRQGRPDAVFELPSAFRVPAEGTVEYQYTAVPTGLTEDRWVTSIEVVPGAPEVVHHVLAYALPAEAFENGRLKRWDLLDERRGFFAAWAPGSEPVVYPEGHARELRAGTVLMFELHYTPNGREALDRSRVGVRFASTDPTWKPDHIVRTAGISNRSIRIPAGSAAHVELSTGIVARPMHVHAFMPHMHLRGSAFRFDEVARAEDTAGRAPLRLQLAAPLRARDAALARCRRADRHRWALRQLRRQPGEPRAGEVDRLGPRDEGRDADRVRRLHPRRGGLLAPLRRAALRRAGAVGAGAARAARRRAWRRRAPREAATRLAA